LERTILRTWVNEVMAGVELIRSLLQQASAQGSRSTALNPLAWAFGLTLSGLIVSVSFKATDWIIVFLSVVSSLILAVFLFAYIYLLFRDRDALRSEKFRLSNIAPERSISGDSLKGFVEVEHPGRRVPAAPTPERREEP
jgi:threonine/homoserine/homoserine lactone efflux protein